MGKMIANEIYKLFKSRKNLIIIGIFFVYLIGLNLYNLNQYNSYMDNAAFFYGGREAQAESDLSRVNQLLANPEDLSNEQIDILEKEGEFYNVERNKLMVISHNYRQNNPNRYHHILIAENERYENINQGLEEGIITESYLYEKNLDPQEMQKQLKLNHYILDNKIDPILNPYTMTGINSLSLILGGNNLIIFMFLIALLSIDVYLAELEEGSYKLSYTQPFKRSQIFVGKVTTLICVSLALVMIAIILNFVILSVVNGTGNINYPIITDESIKTLTTTGVGGEAIIIQTWQYLMMGFALLIPIIILTIVVIMTLSIFTDSTSNTLGITIMLLVLAFIFENFIGAQSIIKLIYPYSYLFMDNIIEASTRANYLFGLLLNSFLAIGLFALSYVRFVKKDFLGAKE